MINGLVIDSDVFDQLKEDHLCQLRLIPVLFTDEMPIISLNFLVSYSRESDAK